MSNFEAVAVYIVETFAELIENEAKALEALASPIDLALWSDDEAEAVRESPDSYPDFSPEDLESFDPRVCRVCCFALSKAIENHRFELRALAQMVADFYCSKGCKMS